MSRRGQGEGSTDRFGEYYRHRITLPDGRRLALYARTREELNEKIETAIAARARGELVTSGRYPYVQWLADNVKPNLAITTWERYSGVSLCGCPHRQLQGLDQVQAHPPAISLRRSSSVTSWLSAVGSTLL